MLTRLLQISLATVLTENLLFRRLLGVSPLLRASDPDNPGRGSACVTSLAMIVTMTLASVLCWIAERWVIGPLNAPWLRTLVFLLILIGLVYLWELCLRRLFPSLRDRTGLEPLLLVINCAVLGTVILNAEQGYGFFEAAASGLMGGVGFALALLLFRAVRERLQFADPPESFEGTPIALVSAGLIAMAFLGFSGMRCWSCVFEPARAKNDWTLFAADRRELCEAIFSVVVVGGFPWLRKIGFNIPITGAAGTGGAGAAASCLPCLAWRRWC